MKFLPNIWKSTKLQRTQLWNRSVSTPFQHKFYPHIIQIYTFLKQHFTHTRTNNLSTCCNHIYIFNFHYKHEHKPSNFGQKSLRQKKIARSVREKKNFSENLKFEISFKSLNVNESSWIEIFVLKMILK